MSINNILQTNGYKIFCKDLEADNLTIDGNNVSVDNLVQRNAADVLTTENIIVGDGTNKIKDSVIATSSAGSIDVPENQGYSVNSQSMAYQSAGDSKYYLEGDIIQAAEKIQTPLIESTADGADINIDSTGNGGRVNIITADNTGFTVRTDARDKWSQLITNSLSQRGLLMGVHDFNGGEDFISIASNTLTGFTPTGWDLLNLQPNANANARVGVGAVNRSEITSSGQRMYVKDGIATDGTYKIMTSATNFHNITGGGSGTFTHTLPNKSGTLAHLSDRTIPIPLASDFTTASGTFVRAVEFIFPGSDNISTSLSNFFVAYSAAGGFLVSIRLQDITNGNTVASSVDFSSAGPNQILTLSSFSNIPTTPARLQVQCSTTTASDITIHSASLQL